MAGGFNLKPEIDFNEPRDQKISSLLVAATNKLSFSLFDRSDELMVNDYEALLTGIDAGGEVVDFFKSLIDDFLLEQPCSDQSGCGKRMGRDDHATTPGLRQPAPASRGAA